MDDRSNTDRPELSVIVPMFQSGPTIAQTLDSIRKDTVPGGVEILVIDDGSTDDGPRIAAAHAAADPRVRVIHHHNRGLAAARNTGIEHALGRWLRFVDADDLVVAESSDRLIRTADRAGCAAACGSHELISESGEPLGRACVPLGNADGVVGLSQLMERNCFGVGTVVLRADALGDTRFDPALRVCEDWDLWLRLAEQAVRFAVCLDGPVEHYRVRRASLSKDFARMLAVGESILDRAFDRARERDASGEDASRSRQATARQRLALEWATMRALLEDDDACAAAAAMCAPAMVRPFSPEDAASAAYWAVLLGLGVRPEELEGAVWPARVHAWWTRCASKRWLAQEDHPQAWRSLSEWLPAPREVAEACLNPVRHAKGLVIIGAGQNGRMLAHAATQAHIAYQFQDDAPVGGCRASPVGSPMPAGWAIAVSPSHDAALTRKLSRSPDVRWSVVRDELAASYSARLRDIAMRQRAQPRSSPQHVRLAVIIPLYNSEATVVDTIRSVQAQHVEHMRIYVVNDGSTDQGPAIVESLAAADPRIRLISQPNRGLAGARNSGIEAALRDQAEHLHFLDADDRMLPGAYEHLLRSAAETGAAYGGYALTDETGTPLGRESPISAPSVGLDEELEWNRAATHARLLAAQTLGDDRFDERLPVCEDYELWLRLETRGVRFQAVERIVCEYRLRPTSLSKKFEQMCRVYQEVTRRAFHAARPEWGEKIDLSDQRFRRVVGHSALMYATMEALREPGERKDAARVLLESSARPERFGSGELAQAACTAVLFGSCEAPNLDGHSERKWLRELERWWFRCEADGLCLPGDAEQAFEHLSTKIIHPDRIAAALLDAAACSKPMGFGIVIIGLDRNGRRLARLCASRGTRTLVLDHFVDNHEASLLEPLPGVTVVRTAEKYREIVERSFPHAKWVSGLPGPTAQTLIRQVLGEADVQNVAVACWNDERSRIGDANLALLRRALSDGLDVCTTTR